MNFRAWQSRSTVAATLLLGFAVGAAAGMLGAPVIDRALGLEVRAFGGQSSGGSGAAGSVAMVVPEEADVAGGAGAGQRDQSVVPEGATAGGVVAGHAAAGPSGHDAANCQVCAKKAFDALGASPDEGGSKTIGGINAPASRGGRRGVTAPGATK